MLVCHCRGITDRQIRRLVRDGATSTREIARATGAGLRCGGCRSNVKRVVDQAVEREFEKRPGDDLPRSRAARRLAALCVEALLLDASLLNALSLAFLLAFLLALLLDLFL